MPEFPSGGKSIVELILVSEDRNKSKRAGLWEWQSGIREGTFFYESTWLKSIKNSNYVVARKFGNIFRFTDDLIAINDGNEFENHYNEIYPSELILKKEITSHRETTFLDLHLCINEGQIQTSLFDKRNSYNFNVVRFAYKSSNISSKMFFATISAEILRICRTTSSVAQFIKTSKVFLHRMLRQGADPLGVEKILVKMIKRHALQFEKYNTNNRDLIQ